MKYPQLSNEIDILELAYKYVEDWDQAIDGGAYLGEWTHRLRNEFDYVCSFEPDNINFSKLKNRFGLGLDHEIRHAALGQFNSRVDFRRKSKTGSYIIIDESLDGDTELISIDSLDLFPGLIKLDLEGAEYLALQGSRKTIDGHKPVIILEDIPRFAKRFGHKPGMALKFLKKMGYVEKYYSYPNYLMVYDG